MPKARSTAKWLAVLAVSLPWLAAAPARADDKYMGGSLATAPGNPSAPGVVIYMCPVQPDGREACEQALSAAVDVDDGWGVFKIGPIPDLRYTVYAWRDVDGDGRLSAGDEWAIFNTYPNVRAETTPPTDRVALRLRRYDGTLQSVLFGRQRVAQAEALDTRPETILGRFATSSMPYDTVNPVTGAYVSTNSSTENLELSPDGRFTNTSAFFTENGCTVFEMSGNFALSGNVITFSDRTQRKKNCYFDGWQESFTPATETKSWRLTFLEGYGVSLQLTNADDAAAGHWGRAQVWYALPH